MTVQINYTIGQIHRFVRGEWLLRGHDSAPEYLSLDSRKIVDPSKTLFWAVNSKSTEGSKFIEELYKTGVRNFVTQKKIPTSRLKGSNIIYVKDAIEALQRLAIAHRKKFEHLRVIGITGSNGKTIVKEWLSELLLQKYQVVSSPRSYNSQIGVPLAILQIRAQHQIGIFEAGISMPGEMEKLEKMIRPDIGIFTTIGSAHDQGFVSRQQKIKEKLLLFKRVTALVYPFEKHEIAKEIDHAAFLKNVRQICWGTKGAQVRIVSQHKHKNLTVIAVRYRRKDYSLTIPFSDHAAVENAISCLCGLIASGNLTEGMLRGFPHLQPVSMRLELKPGRHHSSIINDSYSNDLQSLTVALDFLKQQGHKKKTVILSDLLQSGLSHSQLYSQVAEALLREKVDRLIAIGKDISSEKKCFDKIKERLFFENTNIFLKNAGTLNFQDEAILIKGARKFSFEKISSLLEAHVHQTILSVNLTNLASNIRIYKSLLKPETRLMAMVKAFAYGAGSKQIGSLLQFVKADYLTVAYTEEGVALREAGIELPVMVMNVEQGSFSTLIEHHLEPEIFSFGLLHAFTDFVSQLGIKDYPVHVKIDTGMHRLGFNKTQIPGLVKELKVNKAIKIQSVFSHLSSSDNPLNDDFTRMQFGEFQNAVAQIKTVIPYFFIRHICNTAAISRFPEFQMDMVRLGIGMYGIDDNPKVSQLLKPVNHLSTTISQIKYIKAGEVVGYNRQVVSEDKTIATVGIGYADGFRRILGNGKGRMMIQGKLVSTVGNICMDMTMLDITGLTNVREGDEVTVFGDMLPVQKIAKWAHTIPYEIFTGISSRVRRVYLEEG